MDYSKRPGQSVQLVGKVLNNEKPTISIVTPFYNGGKTLMETANAVFSQTYPYFEWIIVDDGSKDEESLKELAKLEKMDKRISVYHKENGGPSMARDFGISRTSKDTKYVFFLDCDDIPDKTMIECLYWTLETHPEASFAHTKMINFGDREFLWERYLTVEQQKKENLICISSMVRKEDLLEVGCFGIKEKSMYEDWNLWLKLLEKGKIPIRVNAPLFWYRVSGTGEFSRAQKNNENAMKYVNETAAKIKNNVEIIQFPREGNKYAKVKEYNMTLPMYEKNNKTKILFIFPWMVVGGADLFNLDVIKRLDKNKYEAIILTTLPNDNPLRQEFEQYASQVYDLTTFLERESFILFADYIIKSRNINAVVVSNSRYGYYMIPYLKNKYPHIPFVDYIHSIDLNDPREGFGRCSMDMSKYLSGTYCCNNFTREQLVTKYERKDAKTLYIGTDDKRYDPSKFDKDKLKEKYGIPKDKIIISFIARLSDEKRPQMFVEIAKKLLESNKDLFFVIAGDGYLRQAVEKKINNNFKMLGMIDKTEEIYSISDLTINCSSLEGLALTSYESLSMGVPVISTDVGGQTELIDDTVGAIVHYNEKPTKQVYKEEINEYATKTLKVINNLDKIKSNCRKKIQKSFTLDIMIKNFSKIIDDSIEKELKIKEASREIDYNTYELGMEVLYRTYFFYCKTYIESKFGIIYELYYNRNKKETHSKLGKRIDNMLIRCGAKHNVKAISDFWKSFKKTCKLFVRAIVEGLKALVKILLRNVKR